MEIRLDGYDWHVGACKLVAFFVEIRAHSRVPSALVGCGGVSVGICGVELVL